MEQDLRQKMMSISQILADTWKGASITAGVKAGLFGVLNKNTAKSAEMIVEETGFDLEKVNMWLYFAKLSELVEEKEGGYILTDLGFFFSPDSSSKVLLGLIQISQYYMYAAYHADEAFKAGKSVDELSDGKITRDYQPRVSDNFSGVLVDYLKNLNLEEGDSILDIGCGNGSFLRNVAKEIPKIQLIGMDANLFAIELGRKENRTLQLEDRIKLKVYNAEEDMDEFEDQSVDWVMAINVFHFFKKEKREELIDHMIRIARKGVIYNEAVIELSPIVSNADPLMALLWNDFTGFFPQPEVDSLNDSIKNKYPDYQMSIEPTMQGTAYLITIKK